MRRTAVILALLISALLAFSSCGDDTQSVFANDRASFVCDGVSTIAPLRNALNSYGEFCMIWADVNHYLFRSTTASAQVNKTQTSLYRNYICYGGFIVGRSAVTELGTGDYPYLCYDRACPNCYKTDGITRALVWGENAGTVSCQRCHRTYDLNNLGQIVGGDDGRKLLRYRMNYAADILAIQN